MTRIAIYGIGGLYNFGCEAIVRGTVEFLRRRYGTEIIITYYSRNVEQDRRIIDDLDINIVDIRRKSSFIRKCISKVIDILRIPAVPFFGNEFKLIISNSDLIVSVGGDIYTIPKYLRNKSRYRYVNYLVEFGEKAICAGKKVIIYGASIGPFGNYNKAVDYYINHLKKVDEIICREKESVDYLKEQGISSNVVFLPDPAFLVRSNNDRFEKKYLGFNISELSLQELYGNVTDEHIHKICEVLSELVLRTDLKLMLIPHVLSPHTIVDNDLHFMKKIKDSLPLNIKENTMLVEPESFLDVKKYLKQCKIVIT